MFIRQTRTNNKITGEGYFTFRLVRGERIGGEGTPDHRPQSRPALSRQTGRLAVAVPAS